MFLKTRRARIKAAQGDSGSQAYVSFHCLAANAGTTDGASIFLIPHWRFLS
jgi:hypothetical protein